MCFLHSILCIRFRKINRILNAAIDYFIQLGDGCLYNKDCARHEEDYED